jgi:predicted molibdopterin-dependent oxidoreductase YjgC
MFRRIEGMERGEGGTLLFEGRAISFRAGDSVAAALLAAGVGSVRTHAVTNEARAPYCLMGVCFECLAEIDGEPSQQSCLVPARDGMVVVRQLGRRRLG